MGTIMAVAQAASLIGTAVSAAGQYQQGQAQSATYSAQAKAESTNARLAAINADLARSEAQVRRTEAAQDATAALGKMRAGMAQGGILGSATSQSLLSQSEGEARRERERITRAGEIEALNYAVSGANAAASSSILSSNASASKTGGILTGMGTLLGGVSSAYESGRKLNKGN